MSDIDKNVTKLYIKAQNERYERDGYQNKIIGRYVAYTKIRVKLKQGNVQGEYHKEDFGAEGGT